MFAIVLVAELNEEIDALKKAFENRGGLALFDSLLTALFFHSNMFAFVCLFRCRSCKGHVLQFSLSFLSCFLFVMFTIVCMLVSLKQSSISFVNRLRSFMLRSIAYGVSMLR